MQQREKNLGIVFASVLGAFFIVPSIWSWFSEPVNDLQAQLDIEAGKTKKKDDEYDAARAKQTRLAAWCMR